VIPAGGLLGGGSSINLSMYTRAQGLDYDSWNAPGWAAKDIIPLCNRIETYYAGSSEVDTSKHGDSGPVKISDGGFRSESENAVMQTIHNMGMKELADINDFDTIGGFMVRQNNPSPRKRMCSD
jgi:alcohol oxidase